MSLMFLEICSFLSFILLFILLCVAIAISSRLGKIRDYLKTISEGNQIRITDQGGPEGPVE